MKVDEQILARLSEEQQEAFHEIPRQERTGFLAVAWNTTEGDVLKELAELARLEVLDDIRLSEAPEDALPLRLINEYQCLPVHVADTPEGQLNLITAWPPDAVMDDWILAACGRRPHWYLGPAAKVNETITQVFGVGSGSLDSDELEGFSEVSEDNRQEDDEDAALIRFVNEVITKAIADRATDIHFEPQKESLQIRYRIDGELVPVRVPDNLVQFQRAIISRLKIMARLNISERRRPQDGRISFTVGKEDIDIRISSLPIMYGESVSLRLLSNKSQPVTIEDLGFLPRDINKINQILTRPHGIVLATGPTGSGKSTSLSAFLRQIRDPRRRIITIEDPVEYEIENVNQVQVHHEIGLTFASTLRSVLRQDPDVIMVGEIRDRETAEIAIRASLTGHLVLSTLHTNDAPGALTRLIDMEIEPFLIASSVELVIAQRLVRRLCPRCSREADMELAHLGSCLVALHVDPTEVQHGHLLREPGGCDHCRGLGYRGRVGLFEILQVSEEIHEMIIHKASARDIRHRAEAQGMSTLQTSGWEQCKRGITSLDEIMRYADLVVEDEAPAAPEDTPPPLS
ncbi:GspE/PulE family protein [Ruficoccus sp. ZRK36]|uniref:GspE/PulE family protein n=1 Tax=Ruficoccus sp. ZRK36 TaxID=2866311 RepID=UPI00210359B1|nr:GspE/PulE family protein [Ruficoccus sp. ZRK36]